MVDVKIRFKGELEELYNKLRDYCNKNYSSMNECLISLIQKAFTGSIEKELAIKSIKKIKGDKVIVFKYPAKCSRCGREIKAGDLGYYARYEYDDGSYNTVVLCLDCYYSVSDKTLANLIVKRYRVKREIKALKTELEKLVKEYDNLQEERDKLLNEIQDYRKIANIFDRMKNLLYYAEKTIFDKEKKEEVLNNISIELESLRKEVLSMIKACIKKELKD